jgi:hypothetical protein
MKGGHHFQQKAGLFVRRRVLPHPYPLPPGEGTAVGPLFKISMKQKAALGAGQEISKCAYSAGQRRKENGE